MQKTWNMVKRSNMFNWKGYLFEGISKLTKNMKPLIQETLLISSRMNTKEIISRHIIIKMLKTKKKKENLIAARKKDTLSSKEKQ